MLKRLIAAALISGFCVSSAAIADNTEYVSIITKQLDDVETRMKPVMEAADKQMLRVGEIISLTDKERNGAYYLTELEPNTNYLIVGVCDGDCGDLDLQIDDPSGTTLDTDVEDVVRPPTRIDPVGAPNRWVPQLTVEPDLDATVLRRLLQVGEVSLDDDRATLDDRHVLTDVFDQVQLVRREEDSRARGRELTQHGTQ